MRGMQRLGLLVSSSLAFLCPRSFDRLLKTGWLVQEIIEFSKICGALDLLSQSTTLGV